MRDATAFHPVRKARTAATWLRRLALPTVVFFCAALAPTQRARPSIPPSDDELVPATQPTTTQPESLPTVETVAEAQTRVARTLPNDASPRARDHHAALRSALAFTQALQRGDAAAAARLVDATGFHELPLSGPLPEQPEKPLIGDALKKRIAAIPPFDSETWRADHVRVPPARAAREQFPALFRWMLPNDALVEFYAPTGVESPSWRQGPAVLVIRLRGGAATVIGGNLFHAIKPPPPPETEEYTGDGEDK
ncbi:MAG: hypothetical protein IPM18_08315 [Phycisphaerales bacterium]|nr:hypothetical protein [Phycisphaerales bacterium]